MPPLTMEELQAPCPECGKPRLSHKTVQGPHGEMPLTCLEREILEIVEAHDGITREKLKEILAERRKSR